MKTRGLGVMWKVAPESTIHEGEMEVVRAGDVLVWARDTSPQLEDQGDDEDAPSPPE